MVKVLLASLIAFSTVATASSTICNPEQEYCQIGNPKPNDGVGYTPGPVVICNPEQSHDCVIVTTVGGTPAWLTKLGEWFESIGAKPTDPFPEKGN